MLCLNSLELRAPSSDIENDNTSKPENLFNHIQNCDLVFDFDARKRDTCVLSFTIQKNSQIVNKTKRLFWWQFVGAVFFVKLLSSEILCKIAQCWYRKKQEGSKTFAFHFNVSYDGRVCFALKNMKIFRTASHLHFLFLYSWISFDGRIWYIIIESFFAIRLSPKCRKNENW